MAKINWLRWVGGVIVVIGGAAHFSPRGINILLSVWDPATVATFTPTMAQMIYGVATFAVGLLILLAPKWFSE